MTVISKGRKEGGLKEKKIEVTFSSNQEKLLTALLPDEYKRDWLKHSETNPEKRDLTRKNNNRYYLIKYYKESELAYNALYNTLLKKIDKLKRVKNQTISEKREIDDLLISLLYFSRKLLKTHRNYLSSPAEGKKWKTKHLDLLAIRKTYNYNYNAELNNVGDGLTYLNLISIDNTYWWQKNQNEILRALWVSFKTKFSDILALIVDANWWKLVLLRIKRYVSALILLTPNNLILKIINSGFTKTVPVFNHLGYIPYVPRAMYDTANIFAHTLGTDIVNKKLGINFKLKNEEKDMGPYLRFLSHTYHKLFRLCNDYPWLIIGLLGCFYFASLSNPIFGAAATLFLYGVDVINMAAEFYRTSSRMEKSYVTAVRAGSNHVLLKQYRSELDVEMMHIRKKLVFNLLVTTALFVGMAIGFAALFFPPAAISLALIGTTIVLLTCVLQYVTHHYLNHTAPKQEMKIELSPTPSIRAKELIEDLKHTPPDSPNSTIRHDLSTTSLTSETDSNREQDSTTPPPAEPGSLLTHVKDHSPILTEALKATDAIEAINLPFTCKHSITNSHANLFAKSCAHHAKDLSYSHLDTHFVSPAA